MTKLCWVHTGDSISAAAICWPWQYLGAAAKGDAATLALLTAYTYTVGNILFRNMAVAGTGLYGNVSSTNDVTIIAPTHVDPIPAVKNIHGLTARKYLFTSAIGANDGAIGLESSATNYAAAVASMAQARRTAGFDLIGLCTLLPSAVMMESRRIEYNGKLTDSAWRSSHGIDYVIDLAAETTMGNPANLTNATYYSDQLHPTSAGQALLATNIVAPAMTTILGSI